MADNNQTEEQEQSASPVDYYHTGKRVYDLGKKGKNRLSGNRQAAAAPTGPADAGPTAAPPPSSMPDDIARAHETLGAEPGDTPKIINEKYRDLAKSNHPDVGGDPEKMKDINAARDTLKENNYPEVASKPPSGQGTANEPKVTPTGPGAAKVAPPTTGQGTANAPVVAGGSKLGETLGTSGEVTGASGLITGPTQIVSGARKTVSGDKEERGEGEEEVAKGTFDTASGAENAAKLKKRFGGKGKGAGEPKVPGGTPGAGTPPEGLAAAPVESAALESPLALPAAEGVGAATPAVAEAAALPAEAAGATGAVATAPEWIPIVVIIAAVVIAIVLIILIAWGLITLFSGRFGGTPHQSGDSASLSGLGNYSGYGTALNSAELQQKISAVISNSKRDIGVAYSDPSRQINVNTSKNYRAASTLKVAVMLTYLKNKGIPSDSATKTEMSNMIINSDNGAANAIIDKVGGFSPINSVLGSNGQIVRKFGSTPPADPNQDNRFTPSGAINILKAVDSLPSDRRNYALDLMQRSRYTNNIPAMIKAVIGTDRTWNKYGNLSNLVADIAIVQVASGRGYLAVYVNTPNPSGDTKIVRDIAASINQISYPSGNLGLAIVAAAKSALGITHAQHFEAFKGLVPEMNENDEWCSIFVTWATRKAGSYVGKQNKSGPCSSSWVEYADAHPNEAIQFNRNDARFKPQPGDIVVYKRNGGICGKYSTTHAAIVASYDPAKNTYSTIERADKKVNQKFGKSMNDSGIFRFVRILR